MPRDLLRVEQALAARGWMTPSVRMTSMTRATTASLSRTASSSITAGSSGNCWELAISEL